MRNVLSLAGAAVVMLTWVAQAVAGNGTTVPVPEPGSLALLAAGAAAVTLGARWFRRK